MQEGANGEIGFYLINNEQGKTHRLKSRPQGFSLLQAFPGLIKGGFEREMGIILESLNITASEVDR